MSERATEERIDRITIPAVFNGQKRKDFPVPPMAAHGTHNRAFGFGGLYCILSTDSKHPETGELIDHLSVSRANRIPGYEEFRDLRYAIFPSDVVVVQIFPPPEYYVNCHPHCLHLWWFKSRHRGVGALITPEGLVSL